MPWLLNATLIPLLLWCLYVVIWGRTSAPNWDWVTPISFWKHATFLGGQSAVLVIVNFFSKDDLEHNRTVSVAFTTLFYFNTLSVWHWVSAEAFYTSREIRHLPEPEKKIATRRILLVVWAWSVVSALLPLANNGYDRGHKNTWLDYLLLIAQFGPGVGFLVVDGIFLERRRQTAQTARINALIQLIREEPQRLREERAEAARISALIQLLREEETQRLREEDTQLLREEETQRLREI